MDWNTTHKDRTSHPFIKALTALEEVSDEDVQKCTTSLNASPHDFVPVAGDLSDVEVKMPDCNVAVDATIEAQMQPVNYYSGTSNARSSNGYASTSTQTQYTVRRFRLMKMATSRQF
ncbi:MAG: hypothetical protein LBP35_00460 [Candidatus Ancillula trichonymphae]|jgi:hypothetical protein|nr:hypothetical protein [Candidatus Ancillula trichonymphae]